MADLVAIVGSLRKGSFNGTIVELLAERVPAGTTLRRIDISEVPLYDADLEAGGHPAVERLKTEVLGADGLVIATPEYNMAESGVTKNVVDWLSRPVLEGPINQRPIGLVAASPGRGGGKRALEHLHLLLSMINPAVFEATLSVPSFRHRFADDGAPLGDLDAELTEWIEGFTRFVIDSGADDSEQAQAS